MLKKNIPLPKKKEIIENNKYAKYMRIEGKLRNILSDDSIGAKDKRDNIIKYKAKFI